MLRQLVLPEPSLSSQFAATILNYQCQLTIERFSQYQLNSTAKMFLLERSNQALNINPPAGQQHLSVGGSDWLWAVTAVFALAFVSDTVLT